MITFVKGNSTVDSGLYITTDAVLYLKYLALLDNLDEHTEDERTTAQVNAMSGSPIVLNSSMLRRASGSLLLSKHWALMMSPITVFAYTF